MEDAIHNGVDLHVHSTASDGTVEPQELPFLAKESGLCAFALTDHDTLEGIPAARQASEKAAIEFIPGVELSTEYQGKEIHMVGLFLDETNLLLRERLAAFRDNRDNRNEKMFKLLCAEGFEIDECSLRLMFPTGVLTRAHIARYLVENGYVKSMSDVFDKYIGDGCRCFIGRDKIDPAEAIALIHQAGGLAVLAHPVLYNLSTDRMNALIHHCADAGLDGIEAIYSTYQSGDTRNMKKLAADYGLLLSGGSDFHGSNKPHIQLGRGMGRLHVPYSVLDQLKKKLKA